MQSAQRIQLEDRLAAAKVQAAQNDNNIVWKPIAGSSQELALDSRCHHTLFHGARGPGKTITQIMKYRKLVGKGYGTYWRGVIFDKEFKNLSDIVAQSKRFFYQFNDGAKFLSGGSDYKWVWPTGEELLFRHAKNLSDYDNFHGHEYPFQGWNELTKYPTGDLYEKMLSTNRSSFHPEMNTPRIRDKNGNLVYATADGKPLPNIPLIVFSTTNPNGPGHNWVKQKFILPAENGEVVRVPIAIFNPRTQQDEIIEKTQVAIFGNWRENIYLPPEYIADLEQISDPNLRAAWLHGSWDVNAGGAFDDLWRNDVHVIPPFNIPDGWRIDRSFDWGSSHPFSVGWWAEANGEEVTLEDGTTRNFPRGTLFQISEIYGAKKAMVRGQQLFGTNKGVKMSAPDVAKEILEHEQYLFRTGRIKRKPFPGPADNQIRDVTQSDVDTIETKMNAKGVRWTKSDKSKGSRKIGFQLLRDRLEASIRNEGAGIYFMNTCTASVTLVPPLPRDEKEPDDVDTEAEDHAYDMIRYRVLAGANRIARHIEISHPV